MEFDVLFNVSKTKELLNKKLQEQLDLTKNSTAFSMFKGITITEPLNTMFGDKSDDDCDSCEIETDETEDELKEQKIVYRVTSAGKRLKRIKCPPGRRVVTINGMKKCVATTGVQKAHKHLASVKMNRTKRSKGSGYKRKIDRKRLRALKKRKAMGL